MAQVGSIAQTPFRNWQQATGVPPVEERRQQQGHQQSRHEQDARYHIPDDEQEFQIDEYV